MCVSALMMGVLPGRSRGHFWPPYNQQVSSLFIEIRLTCKKVSSYTEFAIITNVEIGNINEKFISMVDIYYDEYALQSAGPVFL